MATTPLVSKMPRGDEDNLDSRGEVYGMFATKLRMNLNDVLAFKHPD